MFGSGLLFSVAIDWSVSHQFCSQNCRPTTEVMTTRGAVMSTKHRSSSDTSAVWLRLVCLLENVQNPQAELGWQVPASVRRVSATANLQKQECTESKSNADSLAGSWDSDPEGSWDSDDDEAAQPVRLEANDRTTKKFEINCGGKAVNQPSSLAAEPLPSPR